MNGYTLLDTLTFATISNFNYPDQLNGAEVSSIYLNNSVGNKMGFVHSNRTRLSIYDYTTDQIVTEFQLEDCDWPAHLGYYMYGDSLFVANPFGEKSQYQFGYTQVMGCYRSLSYLFWMTKGYEVQFRNNDEFIFYFNQNGEYVDSFDAPDFVGRPHIYDDYMYFEDTEGNIEVRDMNNGYAIVYELSQPEATWFTFQGSNFRLQNQFISFDRFGEFIYYNKIE